MRVDFGMIALLAASISACTSEDMRDMMDGMGGNVADQGRPGPMPDLDLGPDRGQPDLDPPDAGNEYPLFDGPPLTIHDLSLRGSYQSYYLPVIQPAEYPDFEHPDLLTQLDIQGIRHLHFDLVYNTSNVFGVYTDSLSDDLSHCGGNLRLCLDPVGQWSRANRTHAPIMVLFTAPPLVAANWYGVLDRLQYFLRESFDRDQIYTMDDLRAAHPDLTVREIVTGPGWPPLDEMRGRFIFVIAEPLARESQRNLDWHLDDEPELLMWLYADGQSDDELAADDAAIALLDPLEDDADLARARQVVDAGFLVYSPAHDEVAYGRANVAGVQIIASKYPDRLFPAPHGRNWPVSCNPYTAPPGCDFRQIENRVSP